MTSRQRVLNAIEHKPVDRMPIDMGIHFSTGISAFAYHNLREYLGLDTSNIEMADCTQGLARVDNDIIERFHIDTILLNPSWQSSHLWKVRGKYQFYIPNTLNPVEQKDGSYVVESPGKRLYMPADQYFFEGDCPPLDLMKEDERIEHLGQRAEYLYKNTDKFTMLMGFPAYFEGIDFACDMLTDPELCLEKNEITLQRSIAYFDKINARFGAYIGSIEVNSDLGMQNAPMCSPESYEEICYPYLKRFCQHVHDNSNIKIFLHSCGSMEAFIPLIIKAGVDVLNPVQISAAHMNPATLKEKYGDKICFWGGGCDTQSVLWSKTPEEVAEHTKQMVNIFKQNSGYVFNQVHNIMGNVPPENIVAMLDTAYENSF